MNFTRSVSKTMLCGIRSGNFETDNELMDVQDYYKHTCRFLGSKSIYSKFGRKIMLNVRNDSDIVSYIMYAFMKTDIAYDKLRGASKQTLRYKAGYNVLSKYLQHWKKHRDCPFLSLSVGNVFCTDVQEKFKSYGVKSPLVDILAKEKTNKLHELLDKVLNKRIFLY